MQLLLSRMLELDILLLLEKRADNFPSASCLLLYCSKTSPSRPVTTLLSSPLLSSPLLSSPLLSSSSPLLSSPLPLLLSPLVLTPHCTQVPAADERHRDLKSKKSVRAAAACLLPSVPLSSHHSSIPPPHPSSSCTSLHPLAPSLSFFLPFLSSCVSFSKLSTPCMCAGAGGEKLMEQRRGEEEQRC